MSNSFIVHVGMPKAGSTFLQEKVFPNMKGVFFWKNFDHQLSGVIEKIPNSNIINLNEKFSQEIESYLNVNKKEKKILISSEGFFGSYGNNYMSNYSSSIILKKMFKTPKIILVIRNQVDIISSNYLQLVSEGYAGSIKRYLGFYRGNFYFNRQQSTLSLNLENLQYSNYIKNYITLFGKENVLVLPFELLKKNRSEFLSKIFDFTGSDFENPPDNNLKRIKKSMSPLSLFIVRFLNNFFKSSISNGAGLIPRQPFINTFRSRMRNSKFHFFMYKISVNITPFSIAKLIDFIDRRKADPLNIKTRKKIYEFYKEENETLDKEYSLGLKMFNYY